MLFVIDSSKVSNGVYSFRFVGYRQSGVDGSGNPILALVKTARSVTERKDYSIRARHDRVLRDGAGASALARFDRDVLSTSSVKTVVIFEGVNDLGIAYGKFEGPLAERFKALATGKKVTAEDIIGGYRQLIARAHARGIQVIAATITRLRPSTSATAPVKGAVRATARVLTVMMVETSAALARNSSESKGRIDCGE